MHLSPTPRKSDRTIESRCDSIERRSRAGNREVGMERPASRRIFLMVAAAAMTFAACGKKTEAPPPPPPTVEVAAVVQKDVPDLPGMDRLARRLRQRRDPPADRRLPSQAGLQGGLPRPRRRDPLRDRPEAVPGDVRPVQGRPRAERGHPRQREDDGGALQTPGRAEGHQPAGARRRRDAGAHGAGQRGIRAGRAREGEARPRVDEGRLAHRRHRRRREGAGRRPRQPSDRHDDGLAGRSHQGQLQPERAGVPRLGGQERRDREGPQRRHEPRAGSPATRPLGRLGLSAPRPGDPRGPRGGRQDGHDPARGSVPEPGQRPAAGPVRQGAGRSGRQEGRHPRAAAGGRRSCRAATRSPSSARTTR